MPRLILLCLFGLLALGRCRAPSLPWPAFEVRSKSPLVGPDQDLDGLPDYFENDIAERFRPVLHKHNDDLQRGLYNIDLLLDNRAELSVTWREAVPPAFIRERPPLSQGFSGGRRFATGPIVITHQKKWRLGANENGRPADLRMAGLETGIQTIKLPGGIGTLSRPYRWEFDSYERIDRSQNEWLIDIDDSLTFDGHAGAPEGRRPVYFHLYPANGRLYLQYWYFLTMNDNREETKNRVWHEGDWEHVAIRLDGSGADVIPQAVNFSVHQSGIIRPAEDCWWSETAALTYDGLQKGFDARHTHLHVWLASNSHASYNRFEPVYDLKIKAFLGSSIDQWTDNPDFEPSGHDEYFPYDLLENMGEAEEQGNLILPKGLSKPWIAFQGRFGQYWQSPFVSTPSPGPLASSRAFYSFHEPTESDPWGFRTKNFILFRQILSWIQDRPDGD